jgi:hypothetical protein
MVTLALLMPGAQNTLGLNKKNISEQYMLGMTPVNSNAALQSNQHFVGDFPTIISVDFSVTPAIFKFSALPMMNN